MVAGKDCSAVADAASVAGGVVKVIKADDDAYANYLSENLASLIVSIAPKYSHILAPASTFGKNFMPRVAALLDVQQVSNIISVETADTFTRPVYGGQAIAKVQSSDEKKIITVRPTAFDPVSAEGGAASIEDVTNADLFDRTSFIKLEKSESDRPELTSASKVVSGGRGVGSAENFALIEKLADKIGAAVGASRAAVDAGYVPNDYQVGQTGKVVAPELYMAIGISGAIQHLAGMKD